MVNDPGTGTNGTVVIHLGGGLGNQMFQYAAALGLAVRQGRALKMEVSAFEACDKRHYQLDCLKVPQDLYTGAPTFQPVSSVSHSIAARVIRRIKRDVFRVSVLRKGVYCE